MKYIIEGYPSYKGSHCTSTILCELSNYYNNPITEAMVFGLGSGLNFSYFSFVDILPRIIVLRDPMLESNFFSNINTEFKWNSKLDINIERIIQYIQDDTPVIAITETSQIGSYYEEDRVNIAGHTIGIVGFDTTNDIFFVTDYITKDIFPIKFKNFIRAVGLEKIPFNEKNIWAPVKKFKITDLEESINKAILYNSNRMLQEKNSYYGLLAINNLKNEILYWSDLPRWEDCCLATYLTLEKVGTGGGGFRNLYGNFLEEVEELMPEYKELQVSSKMREIFKLYKQLSKLFFKCGRSKDKSYLFQISDVLSQIYIYEKDLWTVLKQKSERSTKIGYLL